MLGDQVRSRAYFHGIDAIRFAAAFSVAIFHLGFWSWAGRWDTIDQTKHIFDGAASFESLVNFTWFGWIGVEVFFVISGFVIANSASGASPISFLKARTLRLYPAVWICATCTLVALLLIAGDRIGILIGPYVKSMLLIPRSRWIDGAYWTLAVEISFYALVFVFLLFNQFSFIHRLAWGLTIYSSTFVALNLALYFATSSRDIAATLNASSTVVVNLLLPHGCFFAVGIWLWIATNRRMTTWQWIGLAIALLAGFAEVYTRALEALAFLPAAAGQSPLIPPFAWGGATVCIFVFAFTGDRFVPASEFGRAILRYAGLMTYPLYLLHNIVGAGIGRLLIETGVKPYTALFTALTAVILLSFLICYSLEPALRLLLLQTLNYLESNFLRSHRSLPEEVRPQRPLADEL